MQTIDLRLTLDEECPVAEYMLDGIITEYFPQEDDTYQVIFKGIDETILECMNPDDLAEWLGIDSEFVIATEVLEFA
jgi:hypothetical protein